MRIDVADGSVTLPNGTTIGPSLAQTEFLATPVGQHAEPQDYGTRPWIHYNFGGGTIDGRELRAHLLFYDQMLVSQSFYIDSYPPGEQTWENFSLETERAVKELHDRLLTALLGHPTWTKSNEALPGSLGAALTWEYPWGAVWSYHEPRDGSTTFGISYKDRHQQASRLYEERTRRH